MSDVIHRKSYKTPTPRSGNIVNAITNVTPTAQGIGGNTIVTVGIEEGEGISVLQETNKYTVSHGDTSGAMGTDNKGLEVVTNVEVDKFGHVTGTGSKSLQTELDARFLRKDIDDEARGLITFRDGLDSLQPSAFRESLTIHGATFGDQFGNSTFTAGQFGSGFRAWMEGGISHMEVDNLLVRREQIVNRLTVGEIKSVGGNILVSCANMYCVDVMISFRLPNTLYTCYFDSDNGRIPNNWMVDDLAMCRRWDGANAKYYWMLVSEVGTANGKHYITLTTQYKDGTGEPDTGDEIIQFGSITRADRQSAILISAYGFDAPSIKQYANVDSFYLSGKEATVISPNYNKFTGNFVVENEGGLSPVPAERGEWQPATIYYNNDRVSRDGAMWICIVPPGSDTTEIPSDDGFDWRRETVSNAQLRVLEDEISLKASQSSVNSLGNRVTTAESNITVGSNNITNLVSKTGINNLGLDETLYSKITQNADSVNIAINKIQAGSRNIIHNSGNFQNLRHWSLNKSGGTEQISIVDDPTFGKALYVKRYLVGGWFVLENIMREYFTFPIGQTFTVSYYAKSDTGLSGYVSFTASNGVNIIWDSRHYISLTGGWQRITKTFTVQPNESYNDINFYFAIPEGKDVYIANIQLEPGSIATDWVISLDDLEEITSAFYKFDLNRMSANRRIALGYGQGDMFVEQAGISPDTNNVAFHAGMSHDAAALELINPATPDPYAIITHKGEIISNKGTFKEATIKKATITDASITNAEINEATVVGDIECNSLKVKRMFTRPNLSVDNVTSGYVIDLSKSSNFFVRSIGVSILRLPTFAVDGQQLRIAIRAQGNSVGVVDDGGRQFVSGSITAAVGLTIIDLCYYQNILSAVYSGWVVLNKVFYNY